VTITTTTLTTATTTTTTTTIYDPGNVDCTEKQDSCTVACQAAADRNYAVLTLAVKNGKACTGPTDCQPGMDACPTASPAPKASDSTADMDFITTTFNTTTTTTATADASAVNQSSSAGKAVGIVIGLLVLLALIVCVLMYFRKKKQDQTVLQALKVRLRALVCPKTKLIWLHRRHDSTLKK
jgi:hypothetical protein